MDESLPRELERICTRATAKRASERYQSAHDLADDLKMVRSNLAAGQQPSELPSERTTAVTQTVGADVELLESDSASQSRIRDVVPRGLRSFDHHDAEFFLQLLPGARDLTGLPDVIQFWKARIEETRADDTFAVGLIFGPSGCGKSSMVKAGLLPRLSEHVKVLYVEATPRDTETRLLNGLRQRLLTPTDRDLTQTLACVRRGEGLGTGEKLLIVIDQFEQWLHATEELADTTIRECAAPVRWQPCAMCADVERRLLDGNHTFSCRTGGRVDTGAQLCGGRFVPHSPRRTGVGSFWTGLRRIAGCTGNERRPEGVLFGRPCRAWRRMALSCVCG